MAPPVRQAGDAGERPAARGVEQGGCACSAAPCFAHWRARAPCSSPALPAPTFQQDGQSDGERVPKRRKLWDALVAHPLHRQGLRVIHGPGQREAGGGNRSRVGGPTCGKLLLLIHATAWPVGGSMRGPAHQCKAGSWHVQHRWRHKQERQRRRRSPWRAAAACRSPDPLQPAARGGTPAWERGGGGWVGGRWVGGWRTGVGGWQTE